MKINATGMTVLWMAGFLCCVLSGCSSTGEWGPTPQEKEEAMRLAGEAAALLKAGELEEGLERAREGLDEDPACLPAAVIASECLTSLKRPEEALALLLEPSISDEFTTGCLDQAATLVLRWNQPSIAVIYMERALALDPANADYCMKLGGAQAAAGQEGAAMETYGRALELGVSRYEVIPVMARLALQQDKPKEAEALLEQELTRERLGARELILLGVVKCQLKLEEEGLALFDEALAMGGSAQVAAQFNRGLVLEELDRNEEAKTAYRSALGLDSTYSPAAFHLGRLLFEEGEDKEGLALIDLAIEEETNPLQKRALQHSRDALAGPGEALPSPQG